MKELINALDAGEITLEQFIALMAEMSKANQEQPYNNSMTIEQLIKELQEYPLDTKVNFRAQIDGGRSNSVCDEGEVDLVLDENFSYEIEDGDGPINLGKVLNLTISGGETYYD